MSPAIFTKINTYLEERISIAPLVVFRIVFGSLMLFSTLRFMAYGWLEKHFIEPRLHFHYFGFEWVEVLPPIWMYVLHLALILFAIGILLGFFYRFCALGFFLVFTYVELIDLTYYLNHYYFVSVVSFLMIFLPAHRQFSLDQWLNPSIQRTQIPRKFIFILKLQLALVYFYAGLAKINSDWLLEALPLRIWLPAQDQLWGIGFLFTYPETAYLFSWGGMLYDISIPFFLFWKKTRFIAYLAVIIFHVLTGLLFPIGVFPLVMIGSTLIFFSGEFHQKILGVISGIQYQELPSKVWKRPKKTSPLNIFLGLFLLIQLVFPARYWLYPGNVFWTEEGYRFAWRVMLVEKVGTAHFYVKDGPNGKEGLVRNQDFLNAHQEKQMSFQVDLILQFAHFLRDYYREKGFKNPRVRAEVYVSMNARPGQLLFDPDLDLTERYDTWRPKDWLYPAPNE